MTFETLSMKPVQPDAHDTRRAPRSKMRHMALAVSLLAGVAVAACGGGTTTNTTTHPTRSMALWVANGTNVVEFIPSQLGAGVADTTPHLALNSPAFGAPQGVTFDAAGNLWVIDGGTLAEGGAVAPALLEFTAAQLAALAITPDPIPSVTIRSAGFTFPQQAVFDGNGDLWVSDNGSNAIFVLTPAQLATASNDLAPEMTIASNPAFQGPLGIAFDAAGDLYIANNASTSIFKFNHGVLPTMAGAYTLAPSVTLVDDGQGSIQAPWGLAFDAQGNLWSSNANTPNTIVKFASSQLMTNGGPVPAVTLASATVAANQTLAAPNGIAFDNLGDLAAISSASPFGIADFSAGQLVPSTAAVTPSTFLVGNMTTLNAPAGDSFGPVVN
jgi:sugar lactone lactonase YvrE